MRRFRGGGGGTRQHPYTHAANQPKKSHPKKNKHKQMYGEAQRHYMRAEAREALRLLNEILRQAPNVPEPYQLMGQIYEDQGDMQKV